MWQELRSSSPKRIPGTSPEARARVQVADAATERVRSRFRRTGQWEQFGCLMQKNLRIKRRSPKLMETFAELVYPFIYSLGIVFVITFKQNIDSPAVFSPSARRVDSALLNPRCGQYGSTVLFAPSTKKVGTTAWPSPSRQSASVV